MLVGYQVRLYFGRTIVQRNTAFEHKRETQEDRLLEELPRNGPPLFVSDIDDLTGRGIVLGLHTWRTWPAAQPAAQLAAAPAAQPAAQPAALPAAPSCAAGRAVGSAAGCAR